MEMKTIKSFRQKADPPPAENKNKKMSTQKGTIAPIVIAVIVIGLLYFGYTYYSNNQSSYNVAPAADTTKTESVNTKIDAGMKNIGTVAEEKAENYIVTLSNSGFTPASVTIKVGEKVTFKNDGSGQMWVASAPHPTHTNYPEFDEKIGAGNGQSYEFTFAKAGTWKYHNHLNPTQFGIVVVQ